MPKPVQHQAHDLVLYGVSGHTLLVRLDVHNDSLRPGGLGERTLKSAHAHNRRDRAAHLRGRHSCAAQRGLHLTRGGHTRAQEGCQPLSALLLLRRHRNNRD